MKIDFDKLDEERVKRYIELRKKGYKLKKIKTKRDKEKSEAYIQFVINQLKKRKNKFYIKI